MNRNEAYRKLFSAYGSGNHDEFMEIANQIITDEDKKKNFQLSHDLRQMLYDLEELSDIASKYADAVRIPFDLHQKKFLVQVNEPKKNLSDFISTNETKSQIEKIINEHIKADILSTYNLFPSNKLIFYGSTGCGKGLVAEIFSTYLQYPLVLVNFHDLISNTLESTMDNIHTIFKFVRTRKWVLIIKNLDYLFDEKIEVYSSIERRSIESTIKKGIRGFRGSSILILSFDIEKLPPRLNLNDYDEVLYFPKPTKSQLHQLFKHYFRSFNTKNIDFNALVSKSIGMTPQNIKNICIKSIKNAILYNDEDLTTDLILEEINKYKSHLGHSP